MYAAVLDPEQPPFMQTYTHYMIIRDVTDEKVAWVVSQSVKTPAVIAAQIVANVSFCDFSETVRDIAKAVPVMHFIKQDWVETAINWLDKNTPSVSKQVMGGHMMFWEEPQAFNKNFRNFLNTL
jgi:non-heme chloroperoxidase